MTTYYKDKNIYLTGNCDFRDCAFENCRITIGGDNVTVANCTFSLSNPIVFEKVDLDSLKKKEIEDKIEVTELLCEI